MPTEMNDRELAALAADHEFLAKSGMLPGHWNEIRRFPRFYLRGCADAWMYPPRGARDGEPVFARVLTCDVSRGGLGIVAPVLLYPEQRLSVRVAAGLEYQLKVIWCRRVSADRFAAGCSFVEGRAGLTNAGA